MQNRMKQHQLTQQQIEALLAKEQTGCLAMVGPDGAPYVVPVHFWYDGGAVYIHGLPRGQKLDYIAAEPRVSMAVYVMEELLLDEDGNPCNTNTKYQSVVMQGTAAVVEDAAQKTKALDGIVAKYTPHMAGTALPENMVKGTAVVRMQVEEMTGKHYG